MSRLLLIPFLLIFLLGCASFYQIMIGPDGTIQDCNASGGGIIGASVAQRHRNECVKSLKKIGYLEIEKAGTVGIIFRSDSTYVLRIASNSPAEKAGISPGDRIVKIDGQQITFPKDAIVLLFGEYGSPVELSYEHSNEIKTVKLVRAPYVEVFGKP